MVTCAASLTFQLSVVDSPGDITEGVAPNALIVGKPPGAGLPVTVIVTEELVLPAALLAVSVKVVVLPGVITPEPDTGLTLPITGDIDAEVAFEMFQLNVEPSPAPMVVGEAVNEFITGDPDGVVEPPSTWTFTLAVVVPYWLVAVRI
jgi:hypothetical protein